MIPNHDKLEQEISRELKALPELTAPAAVAGRVMAAIARRAQVPWYRRSWVAWPVAAQGTALAAMLVLFGGLCLAGWEFSHAETTTQALHRAGHWFSGFNTIGSLFNIFADAALVVVKKLGTTFLVACLAVAALGYAIFLGLGTVYFRLAFAKH